jgi:hypothetical protein
MSVDLSTTRASSLANRSLPGGCSFCEVTLTRAGANRLDLSRRPTCCTTQQRPTNTRLLRKSPVWPNTRLSIFERFVRHLQYAAGIGWLQANTFGCSSATLSHVSLLGLFAQQPVHRRTSVPQSVRESSHPSIFGRSPESSDSTGTSGFHGTFGFHQDLRVREPLREFVGSRHHGSLSRLIAQVHSARKTSVLHRAV